MVREVNFLFLLLSTLVNFDLKPIFPLFFFEKRADTSMYYEEYIQKRP